MDDLNHKFAQIIAANYTVDEQPMWNEDSKPLYTPSEEFVKSEWIIDILTVAYIPNVGRIDILIVPEDFEYGDINDTR